MTAPSGQVPSLVLRSASRAGDAGYLAAADLAALAGRLGVDYRLVGGNAVTLLVALHGVTDRVPTRETSDADFGAPADVVGDDRLPAGLADIGYAQQQGNRFVRTHVDVLRLLEAAAAAGVHAAEWPVTVSGRDAGRVLHRYFGRRAGTGVADAVSAGGLPVRLNALVQQVVAAPP